MVEECFVIRIPCCKDSELLVDEPEASCVRYTSRMRLLLVWMYHRVSVNELVHLHSSNISWDPGAMNFLACSLWNARPRTIDDLLG